MKHKIPAVIFAGGKSSRMGKDKALLPFGTHASLTAYQYFRLEQIFDTVYVSSKTKDFGFDAPIISDLYPDYSPMAGLVSVFESLDAERCFILSVDAPFVTEEIIAALMTADTDCDAVIARSHGKVQPLCGIYSRSILPRAKTALQQGLHKMGILLAESHTVYVDFDEEDAFININRPDEYKKALRLLEV